MTAEGVPPERPLAILAGGGSLPGEIAAALRGSRREHVLLPLRGFADAGLAGRTLDPLDPRGVLRVLSEVRAGAVVLAGAVHRPSARMVLAGWQAVRHSAEIRAVVEGGDDNLLRGVVRFLESNGFPVLGVRDVAPGLMAREGVLGTARLAEGAYADIARGHAALRLMGEADIGQALVVGEGRVLAVEAAEGTDAMIRRVATLRRAGPLGLVLRRGRRALGQGKGGVLVKAPKPGQDFRVDLPVVGPRTVACAAAARLDGIAVEAGGVLLVERERTLAAADRHGLFVVGVAA